MLSAFQSYAEPKEFASEDSGTSSKCFLKSDGANTFLIYSFPVPYWMLFLLKCDLYSFFWDELDTHWFSPLYYFLCVYTCSCLCVCRPDVSIRCPSLSCSTLFLETGLLICSTSLVGQLDPRTSLSHSAHSTVASEARYCVQLLSGIGSLS